MARPCHDGLSLSSTNFCVGWAGLRVHTGADFYGLQRNSDKVCDKRREEWQSGREDGGRARGREREVVRVGGKKWSRER